MLAVYVSVALLVGKTDDIRKESVEHTNVVLAVWEAQAFIWPQMHVCRRSTGTLAPTGLSSTR